MEYGDFTSLVQPGVGLHVGTALLQLYGELGLAPLTRSLNRTRRLFSDRANDHPPKENLDELEQLESQYEIFQIRLFNEYRRYVLLNLVVAAVLAGILILLAFKADDPIAPGWLWTTILVAALSVLPGPISVAVLWRDASEQMKPMLEKARALEKRATPWALEDP